MAVLCTNKKTKISQNPITRRLLLRVCTGLSPNLNCAFSSPPSRLRRTLQLASTYSCEYTILVGDADNDGELYGKFPYLPLSFAVNLKLLSKVKS